MISGLYGSIDIIVSNGSPSLPYINGSSSEVIVDGRRCHAGDVRYMHGEYQIFNNGYWTNVSRQASVSLSANIIQTLEWANAKMKQEQTIREHAEKYPSVKSALESFNQAQERLDLMIAITSGKGE